MKKLTNRQWRNIKINLESRDMTVSEVCKKYHIAKQSVYSKAKYHNWNILIRKPKEKKEAKSKSILKGVMDFSKN
jgi:predicted DNA-binding protein YlxM (UPF0122 family)